MTVNGNVLIQLVQMIIIVKMLSDFIALNCFRDHLQVTCTHVPHKLHLPLRADVPLLLHFPQTSKAFLN